MKSALLVLLLLIVGAGGLLFSAAPDNEFVFGDGPGISTASPTLPGPGETPEPTTPETPTETTNDDKEEEAEEEEAEEEDEVEVEKPEEEETPEFGDGDLRHQFDLYGPPSAGQPCTVVLSIKNDSDVTATGIRASAAITNIETNGPDSIEFTGTDSIPPSLEGPTQLEWQVPRDGRYGQDLDWNGWLHSANGPAYDISGERTLPEHCTDAPQAPGELVITELDLQLLEPVNQCALAIRVENRGEGTATEIVVELSLGKIGFNGLTVTAQASGPSELSPGESHLYGITLKTQATSSDLFNYNATVAMSGNQVLSIHDTGAVTCN